MLLLCIFSLSEISSLKEKERRRKKQLRFFPFLNYIAAQINPPIKRSVIAQ